MTQSLAQGSPDYTAEIHFGVVMYGGVSLAIYINGVASELLEMACATPLPGFLIDGEGQSGTREIYRRLSWLTGSEKLRKDYADAIRERNGNPADAWKNVSTSGSNQTRLVVDVIAGTSAGGINGIFLAKALANGERFGPLKDLWVTEGDIGLLLNDRASYSDVPGLVDRSQRPASLLNSDRMYAKLLLAMNQMKPLNRDLAAGNRGSPLVDELDLFVTTTDIEGSAVPLRLFDNVVYERRFKQSYRFRYPDGVTNGGNDFARPNAGFLAFAARCTSSFPFAFEPMTLAGMARLTGQRTDQLGTWRPFFPNLPREEVEQDAHVHRAFGDGGYLDNKPFSYVVDTLTQRSSDVPIERKLVFVEPAPETIDPHRLPDPARPPDALENSLAALSSIPRYETIREDLQSVLERNRRIERVEHIVRMGETDAEEHASQLDTIALKDGKIPDWASLKLSEMARYYGLAFLPYQRLRVYAVTDSLAERLGARWGIDRESDQQYGLRALVRVWREGKFDEEGKDKRQTVNAFLDQFDLDYRIRRAGLLLRRIDQLTRLFRKRTAGPVDKAALSELEQHLVARLPEPFLNLGEKPTGDQLASALHALLALKAGLTDVRARLVNGQRGGDGLVQRPKLDPRRREELKEVLMLVLGQGDPKRPLKLEMVSGPPQEVGLDAATLKLASISRTLQEGVKVRAEKLFGLATSSTRTVLQEELEADLEAMRFKRKPKPDEQELTLSRISGEAWSLLGGPVLKMEADHRIVVAVKNETGKAELDTAEGRALRLLLGDYYMRFDSFDQMSFPLYYDTGTGEPSTVEVVRISPADATGLIDEAKGTRRKLAGTALGNFGAFLDRRWRLNDIMWGRLDGAERLIQALLPMSDADTRVVRDELIRRAHCEILRETLVREGNGNLADAVVKGIDALGTREAAVQHVLQQLWTGSINGRDRLQTALASLLSDEGLRSYVSETRDVDRNLDPQATMKNAARAVNIMGRVLEGVSEKHGTGTAAPRWLARLGLALQGIVAVSVPGALTQRWWTHGVKVLYAFELFAVAIALPLANAEMRRVALTALGVTAGVHLITLIAGDAMRVKKGWIRALIVVGAAALTALAVVGARALTHRDEVAPLTGHEGKCRTTR